MAKQQTKAIPEFPRALYGCEEQGCAEEESHFPEDLWLITNAPKGWDPGWYCEGCADEAHFQNPDTQTGETLEHYLGLERDRLKAVNAELFEALSDLVHWATINDDEAPVGLFVKARKAIAKAEGRE